MNVLIVAAHPDDEVLGAGAAMAAHARAGDRVCTAILGEGVTSRSGARAQADPSALEALRRDARRAGEILGCRDLRLFGLPDNRFDGVELLDVVKLVEQLVDEVRPEIVYTHFHGDLNVDHGVTARAVLTACRPLPGAPVRRLLAFEVPSATGWGRPDEPFSPTVFADARETLPLKLEAMRAYTSEVRPYPHPRAPEALAERARSWGTQVGLYAAEPFVLLREILR